MKMPPIAKIYEAYSALADERVTMKEKEAIIVSSNKEKSYTVRFQEDTYASNDNATYWQGYPGYPVLAVLMKQGKLPVDEDSIKWFKNIDWHQLNIQYKRDYDKAVHFVLDEIEKQGADVQKIQTEVQDIYEKLKALPMVLSKTIKKGE